MGIVAHKAWRDVVTGHYGSIDAFEDARTIRIMLGGLTREGDELARIRSTMTTDEQRAEWDSAMWEEEADIRKYRAELVAWLEKRGLEL
jgi:hypothetical protein